MRFMVFFIAGCLMFQKGESSPSSKLSGFLSPHCLYSLLTEVIVTDLSVAAFDKIWSVDSDDWEFDSEDMFKIFLEHLSQSDYSCRWIEEGWVLRESVTQELQRQYPAAWVLSANPEDQWRRRLGVVEFLVLATIEKKVQNINGLGAHMLQLSSFSGCKRHAPLWLKTRALG